MNMIECESVARKWGNSIGLTIPKDIASKINLKENKKIRLIILENSNPVKKTFGMLRNWKTPTRDIIKEMRKDSWDD